MSDQVPTNPPPPAPNYGGMPPVNQDAEHLKLLAIFHYIMGGLTALTGCFFLIYAVIGAGVGFGVPQDPSVTAEDAQAAQAVGALFGVIGVLGTAFCVLLGGLIALSGRKLQQRKGRTFSYIIAAFLCLNMPLGTALGVFTFVVLGRDSVKAMYDEVARIG